MCFLYVCTMSVRRFAGSLTLRVASGRKLDVITVIKSSLIDISFTFLKRQENKRKTAK